MAKFGEDVLMGKVPFLLFVAVFVIVYIYNTHQAEYKLLRELKLKRENSEIEADLNSVRHRIIEGGQAVRLEKVLREIGSPVKRSFPQKVKPVKAK